MNSAKKRLLLEKLAEYTEDEKVYRELYGQKSPEKRAAFLEQAEDYVREHGLFIPDYSFVEIPEHFTEEMYSSQFPIGRGFDVNLVKHSRYTPVFVYSLSFFEILYVLRGTCGHRLGSEMYTLHRGDVCFISPGVKHTIEVFDDSLILSVHVRKDTFDRTFHTTLSYDNILSDFFIGSLYSRRPPGSILFPETGEEIEDIILEMYSEVDEEDVFSRNLLNNLLTILFARLLRGYRGGAYIAGTPEGAGGDPVRLRILSYIYDHYREADLGAVAGQFHYSAAHCSRMIRAETGYGFSAFLRRIRAERAAAYLTETKRTVADIGMLVGYESPEVFIRAFEKVFGMSPTAYRKRKQGDAAPVREQL